MRGVPAARGDEPTAVVKATDEGVALGWEERGEQVCWDATVLAAGAGRDAHNSLVRCVADRPGRTHAGGHGGRARLLRLGRSSWRSERGRR